MAKVDRVLFNALPPDVAQDERLGPVFREIYEHLDRLRERGGGDVDQVALLQSPAPVAPRKKPAGTEVIPINVLRRRRERSQFDVLGLAGIARARRAARGQVPIGAIIVWSGAITEIPDGYALCDGSNGTDDFTDRFVIHADADSGGTRDVDTTGGAHSVSSGAPSATTTVDNDGGGSTVAVGSDTHTHTVATLPKYFAKAYIQRIS